MSDRPDLEQLRRVAEQVAAEWGLEPGPPFALSRYALVLAVGGDAVLKVTPPDDDEADEEVDALAVWGGCGAVRLLRHDRARRALLLERADPGDDLSGLPDDEATAVAVDVGRKLWRPAGAPFRWIGDHVPRWLRTAAGGDDASPALLRVAGRLLTELDPGRATLVHGDFHHHNILRSTRGWLAIDPKPMLGEPEFDVPPFLWNPLQSAMRVDVSERRIAAFVGSGLDERRIRAWTVIRGAYLRSAPEEVEAILALAP